MEFQLTQEQLKKIIYFLTIKGKKNDGVKFISKALKKRCKIYYFFKKIKKYKNKIIKVKNEIKFLNNFAKLKKR